MKAAWKREMLNMGIHHNHTPLHNNSKKKTIFLIGDECFQKGVWYGHCAVCGELIHPPKIWYWLRRCILPLICVLYFAGVVCWLHLREHEYLVSYILLIAGGAGLIIAGKLALNASLAFAQWQPFQTGVKAVKLYGRCNRKSEKTWWITALVIWTIEAIVIAPLFFLGNLS